MAAPPNLLPAKILPPVINGEVQQHPRQSEILTPGALAFLAELQVQFGGRRVDLISMRYKRRQYVTTNNRLDFSPTTRHVRTDPNWRVAPVPEALQDRRVEITGPTDRKMTINALNSGANVWLADLEDANTPHFWNVIDGQVNLFDAIREQISYTSPEGKEYRVTAEKPAVIMMRPRGLHMMEKHLLVGPESIPGCLVDFGLYFYHNAKELLARGAGPFFYLAKMEHHTEARFWHDVFSFAEEYLDVPHGSTKACVLIETIPAAFQMEEILYELREYSAGLNAGRWDYVFSIIKKYRDVGPEFILPDRQHVTMNVPFMKAYSELLVHTCHKRGAHAIGGMSAFLPSKDEAQNEFARKKVDEDKHREAGQGFDGSWVAHPSLVPQVREIFTEAFEGKLNQVHRTREDVNVTQRDLQDFKSAGGSITDAGLERNIKVALQYLESWLSGRGAVAIDGLMEDAATAEISRSQIWQWIHYSVKTEEGTEVTKELVESIMQDQSAVLKAEAPDDVERNTRIDQARRLFREVALNEIYPTFLTIPAYMNLVP